MKRPDVNKYLEITISKRLVAVVLLFSTGISSVFSSKWRVISFFRSHSMGTLTEASDINRRTQKETPVIRSQLSASRVSELFSYKIRTGTESGHWLSEWAWTRMEIKMVVLFRNFVSNPSGTLFVSPPPIAEVTFRSIARLNTTIPILLKLDNNALGLCPWYFDICGSSVGYVQHLECQVPFQSRIELVSL